MGLDLVPAGRGTSDRRGTRRSPAAYDGARETAGDRWAGATGFDKAYTRTGFNQYTQHTAWTKLPIEAARDAVSALRAAMPEVVIPAAPPTLKLPGNGLWEPGQVMFYVTTIGALLLVIVLIRRC